jgi:hypothetical protein
MELGQTKNEIPKVTPEFTEKVDKWMKTFPGNHKDSGLVTENRISEVRGELDKKYINNEQSLNKLKDPKGQTTVTFPLNKKVEKKTFASKLKKFGRRAVLFLGLSAISLGAKGKNASAEKAFTDSAKGGTEKVIGATRKVKDVPNEYTFSHSEGEKKFYKRTLQGGKKELGMAKASDEKGGPEYEKKMISFIKSGISPQELADKKYISPDKIPEYQKYVEQIDYVYTEPEKKKEVKEVVNPYSAYAVKGENFYLPSESGPNAGDMYYDSKHSKNIQESGILDTGKEDFVMELQGPNGQKLGLWVKILAKEKNKYFGTTNHLLPGAYEALIELAKKQMNTTYSLDNQKDLDTLNQGK